MIQSYDDLETIFNGTAGFSALEDHEHTDYWWHAMLNYVPPLDDAKERRKEYMLTIYDEDCENEPRYWFCYDY